MDISVSCPLYLMHQFITLSLSLSSSYIAAFTGILTLLSMLAALAGIVLAEDPQAAYHSTLFIQSILSISLFIIIFTCVLAVGMLINAELAAQW